MTNKMKLSASMLETLNAVGNQGLHKTAEKLYGIEELDLAKVAGYLCSKLYENHRRREKVAAGLDAIRALAESKDIEL